MNRREAIFSVCALVFVFHFTMTILHNTPERYISSRMDSYSHLWCYPVFHQGWALFAPKPQDMTKHMDMRFYSQDSWTDWYRAEDICMTEHLKYRVTHYSKLCHVAQNATYHLWLELDRFEQQDLSAEAYYPSATGYGIAIHFARKYAFHFLNDPLLDSLEVKLVLEDPFEKDTPQYYSFPISAVDVD